MREWYAEAAVLFGYMRHIVLLAARWLLAFGFLQPAMMKLNDFSGTERFFQSLHIPFYVFFAHLVPMIEASGIVLLVLGLFTRIISLFLAIIMITAIVLVHWSNGFSVANNGFEIPLYYLLFSLIFMAFGPGKYSLDYLMFKEER